MVNRSKAKGTAWETAVVNALTKDGHRGVERRALQGALDKGDIAGIHGVVIECKNAQRIDLAGWLDEAEAERINAGAWLGAVWFKRKGKTDPMDGYVLMSGRVFSAVIGFTGGQWDDAS